MGACLLTPSGSETWLPFAITCDMLPSGVAGQAASYGRKLWQRRDAALIERAPARRESPAME